MKYVGMLVPILSGTFFGAAGAFVRTLSAAGLDNYTILSTRAILAALLLFLVLLACDRSLFRIHKKDVWVLVCAGAVGMFGLNLCYNEAIGRLTLSLAAVLLSLSPVFVLFLAAPLFGEKLTWRKIGCVALCIVGCVLVSGVLESASGMTWSGLGILIGVLSAFFYALYNIFSKIATRRGYPALTITFYSILVLALVSLPLTDWAAAAAYVQAAPAGHMAFLLVNAACTSVLPYIFYTLSFRYVDAGKTSILAGGSETVAAMLFGLLLFSETPTLLSLAGIALTILALSLLCMPDKKERL